MLLSHVMLFLGLAQASAGHGPPSGHGYKSSGISKEQVGPALSAENLVAEAELPKSLDIRNLNGKSFATSDWNQHLPQYCGACWVHGTLSALNDRIKLMRGGQYPDVRLGRQSIMNCVPDPENASAPPPGCNGGDARMIHRYMHQTKVPDETCMPWQGLNQGCRPDTVCRNCATGEKGCWAVPDFIGFGVSSYGTVSGEQAMMKEIFARGPIACRFATDDPWMFGYSENVVHNDGVYVTKQKKTAADIDHIMEVAGWGESPSGVKYWVIRNSWGTYWGEAGWAKLERGVNSLMVETDCAWAAPTWEGLDEALAGRTLGGYVTGQEPRASYGGLASQAESELGNAVSEGGGVLTMAVLGAFVAGTGAALVAVRSTRRQRVREPSLILG